MSNDDNETRIEKTRGVRATTTMNFDDFSDSTHQDEQNEATLQMANEVANRIAEAAEGDIGGTINTPTITKRRHPILKLLIVLIILGIAAGATFVYTQGKDALLRYTPEQLKPFVSLIFKTDTSDNKTEEEKTERPVEQQVTQQEDLGGLDSEIVQAEASTVVEDFNPEEIIEKTVEVNSSDDVNLEMLEQQMRLLEEGNIDDIDETILADEKPSFEKVDQDEQIEEVTNDDMTTAETDEASLVESFDIAKDDTTEDLDITKSLEDEELVIAEPTPQYQLTATDQKVKKFIELYKIDSDRATELAGLIGEAANANNLEAILVAAICAAESSYDAEVVSDAGKIGLMQLSNADLKNIIELSKGELSKGNLKDPAYNLKAGLWYIKFLQYYYKGDLKATLAAYEMGQKEYETLRRSGKELPNSTKRFDHNVHNVYKLISKQNPNNADRAFKKSAAAPKPSTTKPKETKQEVKKAEVKIPEIKKPEIKKQEQVTSIPVLRKIISFTAPDKATIDKLEKLVIQKSNEKSLDPVLVASIVMAESSFQVDALSESGKVGLLQIDPERAPLMAKETGKEWLGAKELLNPDYNLELGIAYLSYCTVAFPKDFRAAALCFNAGEKVAKDLDSAPAYTASYLKNLRTYFRLWGAKLPKGMKF